MPGTRGRANRMMHGVMVDVVHNAVGRHVVMDNVVGRHMMRGNMRMRCGMHGVHGRRRRVRRRMARRMLLLRLLMLLGRSGHCAQKRGGKKCDSRFHVFLPRGRSVPAAVFHLLKGNSGAKSSVGTGYPVPLCIKDNNT
jgi:hypothetical protein